MGCLALIITCLTWECEWQGCMLKVKSKTVWLHLQNQQTSVEVNQTLVTHPLLSAQIVDKALKCLSKHKHISLGLKATPFCAVYVSIKQPHLSLLWFTRECQDSKQRRIPPGTLHLLGLGCQQPPKNLWQQHFSDFTGRVKGKPPRATDTTARPNKVKHFSLALLLKETEPPLRTPVFLCCKSTFVTETYSQHS